MKAPFELRLALRPLLAAAALLALVSFACRPGDAVAPRPETKTDAAQFPRTVSDDGGETLTIAAPPRRIVSQTLATDEILLAISEPERIIALSPFAADPRYSNVSDQAARLARPLVKDAEQIIDLKPDLIFVSSYSRAETVDLLRATGAPVFRFANFDRLEDIKRNISIVGRATGADERAAALVAEMEREIERLRARIPAGGPRPRVLSFSPAGYTAGAETLFDDVVRAAGAENVAAERNLKGFPKISVEQLAAWKPDYIVTGSEPDRVEETRRRLLADPVVAASEAARANRVIVIDNRHFLAVSQYTVRLLDDLTKALYEPPQH